MTHTKGVDNVIADCLSRRICRGQDEEDNFAVGYLRDWAMNGQDLPAAEVLRNNVEPEPQPGPSTDRPNRFLHTERTIIKEKNNQIILELGQGRDIGSFVHKFRHLRTTTLRIGPEVITDKLAEYLNQLIQLGKKHYVYSGEPTLLDKVKSLYESLTEAPLSDLVICTRKLRTIERDEDQIQTLEHYHRGITSHGG